MKNILFDQLTIFAFALFACSFYTYLSIRYYYSDNPCALCEDTIKQGPPYITCYWKYGHGLGNYMFQYATMLGLAIELNVEPVMAFESTQIEWENVFEYQIRTLNESVNWTTVSETCVSCYTPDIYLDTNYSTESLKLNGFLASPTYFENIRNLVVSHFTFRNDIVEEAESKLLNITKEFCCDITNCLLIGVHIRRGDFLNQAQIDYGYLVADVAYIQQSVQWYSSKYPNFERVFVVLGIDFEWNNDTFSNFINETSFILKPTTSEGDMCLLSMCNHTIMTVGTFGFWTAYIAGGNVVYAKNSTRNGSQLATDMREFVYPSNWIGL